MQHDRLMVLVLLLLLLCVDFALRTRLVQQRLLLEDLLLQLLLPVGAPHAEAHPGSVAVPAGAVAVPVVVPLPVAASAAAGALSFAAAASALRARLLPPAVDAYFP